MTFERPTITEPEVAIAMSRCITARIAREGRALPITTHHPARCTWCEWPVSHLVELVEAFNAWAGWSERSRTYEQHTVRVFVDLPAKQREAMIVAAQEFELVDDPERWL